MKVLAGVYQKDAGEILLERPPGRNRQPARRRRSMASASFIRAQSDEPPERGAEHLHRPRAARATRRVPGRERAQRAGRRRIFETMHLQLDPPIRVGTLSVAKQQLWRSPRPCRSTSRVLIMDEPTAALNSAEVADLFRIIRQLKARGVGIVYISHKMDELQQIADRVTVMRDGQYIATVPMATTPVDRIIGMMVGRELVDAANHAPDASRNGMALEVRHLSRGANDSRCELFAAQGRNPRLSPGSWAPAVLKWRAPCSEPTASTPARFACKAREYRSRRPRMLWLTGWAIFRGPQALRTGDRAGCGNQHRAVEHEAVSEAGRLCRLGRHAGDGTKFRQAAADQDTVGGTAGAAALGRQPAEDRDREMAAARLRTSCFSTSPRAASTSAPRARSTSCSMRWPSRARRS